MYIYSSDVTDRMYIRPFSRNSRTTLVTFKVVLCLSFCFFFIKDYTRYVRCFVNDNIQCYTYYKPSYLRCSWSSDDKFAGYFTIAFNCLIMVVIVVLNVITLVKIAMLPHLPNFKAVKTIALMCWIFILSYIPYFLISKHFKIKIHSNKNMVKFTSEQFINLNIIMNPII